MINTLLKRNRHFLVAAILVPMLGMLSPFSHAEDSPDDVAAKKAAALAMTTWLSEVDSGDSKKSWADSSSYFQKSVSEEMWEGGLTNIRTHAGKCLGRELISASHQSVVPSPSGDLKGDFVLAEYKTKFEGLASAVETVTFKKEDDGSWKAAGYYIKPGI